MPDDAKRIPEERSTTDKSLRTERTKTDRELSSGFRGVVTAAQQVVEKARGKADAVLDHARDLEDQKLALDGSSIAEKRQVDTKRTDADRSLVEERADADETAEEEEVRRKKALANLLAVEREDTNLRLQIERARADQAVDSREDFLAMVSHDLRSLLGGVALSAERLKRLAQRAPNAAEIARHVESIQRFSARMDRLVGDLMDIASIDAGKLAISPGNHDAAEVVAEAVAVFSAAAAARHIDLTREVPREALPMKFDEERVLQVLVNLVGNAIKFTQDGGRVRIRVEPWEGGARFAVEDNGEGIEADRLEAIFERFYQTHTHDRRGLGLGLYIARSIVEAHGGRIWAESTPGKSSTFYFTLPPRAGAPEEASVH